ncbi:MAG: hypothetical protein EZS28_030830 [Streblomastix strix]|uniref:Uncharacterized protein n=1 Tax=Streblomastix strix TaxID=222440 RepID=A0A5J4UUB7_9EUKA|nr:MAG: hypothetical protein EZS28_030830 [Streblomastix strix]
MKRSDTAEAECWTSEAAKASNSMFLGLGGRRQLQKVHSLGVFSYLYVDSEGFTLIATHIPERVGKTFTRQSYTSAVIAVISS